MKREITILSSFTLILLFISSCVYMGPSIKGNGKVVEEKRKVQDFEKIDVSRGMNVYISQGEYTKVVVKADENLLEAIETITEGDVLKIKATQNIRSSKSKKVFITTPHINEIKASSGSNVYSETELNFKKLKIYASSGSNMNLEINSEFAESKASSGSNIKLKGTSNSFQGKASSGANIQAGKLKSEDCTARASSGSNIWITAKTDLDADVSSGANVFVYGNPKNTNIDKSSGGNVINK